jgi:hypothetical protein
MSQISIFKFLHSKVLCKPRTLKCENLAILIWEIIFFINFSDEDQLLFYNMNLDFF